MTKKKSLDFGKLGKKELSLAEKVNVLSSRCRAQGVHLADMVGISAVTLSKVANEQAPATRKVRDALIAAGAGFVVEKDFATGPQPTKGLVEPAAKPVRTEKPAASQQVKKPTPAATDDDDLDI